MKRPTLLCGLLAFTLSGAVQAGTDDHPLEWLSGRWCSDADGALIEERWLPSTGEMMIGVNRTIADNRTRSFEFLRIEVDEDRQIHYVAQPGGRPPVRFLLTDSGHHWARFENPDHDFPRRIEYRRQGDQMTARIAGPGEGGADFEIPFEFSRCDS